MAGAGANPAGTGEQLLMRLLQTQQEQMGQLQRLLEQNQRPRGTVVDTKAIGRPEKLGGTLEEASRAWRQWNYRLELWLTSQFPDTRAILTWARTQDEEITVARLREQLVDGVTPEKVQQGLAWTCIGGFMGDWIRRIWLQVFGGSDSLCRRSRWPK